MTDNNEQPEKLTLAQISEKLKEIEESGVSATHPSAIKFFKQMVALQKEDPVAFEDFTKEKADITERIYSIPKYKNNETRKEITSAIEGGFELFNTFSNLAAANRQIKDAKTAAESLVKPETPSVKGKNQDLINSTEGARRDRTQRIKEIDPILQRNLDMMRSGLGVARTASTGQAGSYGALGQNVINQARRSNNAAIPQIAAIRRQQDSRYDKLVGQGIQEDAIRDAQLMNRYGIQNENYQTEAAAIGQLGAIGRENRANIMQGMGGAVTNALQPLSSMVLNNSRFNNARSNGIDMGKVNDQSLVNNAQRYTSLGNISPEWDSKLWEIENNLASRFTA